MSSERPPAEPRFPRRAASALRTRHALVSAASALFTEKGYGATTIQAIADRAGVARPTVFTAVPGGKPQLLKEARDRAAALEQALATAAATDPALAELHGQARHQRHPGAKMVADRIGELGGLRPALTPDGAADTGLRAGRARGLPAARHDRGWHPDAYERWLAGQLRGALLG